MVASKKPYGAPYGSPLPSGQAHDPGYPLAQMSHAIELLQGSGTHGPSCGSSVYVEGSMTLIRYTPSCLMPLASQARDRSDVQTVFNTTGRFSSWGRRKPPV